MYEIGFFVSLEAAEGQWFHFRNDNVSFTMEKEAMHGNFGSVMQSQRLSTSIHVGFWIVLGESCY